MNWYLDVFAEDCMSDNACAALAAIQRIEREDGAKPSGPCEDDCEVTCPYVDMLPEESGKEHGSPLNFGVW